MYLDKEGWRNSFQKVGALWIHDGNLERPHVKLSWSDHSNGYFKSEFVTTRPGVVGWAASDLVDFANKAGLDLVTVDWVIGPAMGAIILAHEIAMNITTFGHGRKGFGKSECQATYTESMVVDGKKTMVIVQATIREGENVLVCDDALTTGGSIAQSADAAVNAGGKVLPYALVMVNRSGKTEIDGRRIISLADIDLPIWNASTCPECAKGSKAIRPDSMENWARLNAEYPVTKIS